jgi:hypothetical protein
MEMWQIGALVVVTVVAAVLTAVATGMTPRGGTYQSSTSLDGRVIGYSVWRWDAKANQWIEASTAAKMGGGNKPTTPGQFDGSTVRVLYNP